MLFALSVIVLPWAAIVPLTVRLRVPKSNVQVGPETVSVPSRVQADAEQHAGLAITVAASHADTAQTAMARDGNASAVPSRVSATRERSEGRRGRWCTRTSGQVGCGSISTGRAFVNAV